MKKRVTSHDVAQLAGVSRATVSHVVNRTKYVSAELERRVMSAIESLGYRPNAVARSLKMQRTQTVGLVAPRIATMPPLIQALEERLAEHGLQLVLSHSNEDPAREAQSLDTLAHRRVDGLVVIPAGDTNAGQIASLLEAGLPVVFCDRQMDSVACDAVTSDNYGGGFMAGEHLLSHGRSRVAIVSPTRPELSSAHRDRLEGCRRAILEAGGECLVRVAAQVSVEAVEEVFLPLLDTDRPPDAVFAADHTALLGVLQAVRRRGVRMPEEMSLVTFDDATWLNLVQVPVTAVAQNTLELARKAIDFLAERVHTGYQGPPRRVRLPVHLLPRRSCGCS